MARSLKKGPFVALSLEKKVQKNLEENLGKEALISINIGKFHEEMFQQVPDQTLSVPINRLLSSKTSNWSAYSS